MGVAYCAAAWALLQGLEYATTTFHWPEPIQQLATLALLVGLPIVLVLAWYQGDRGEQHFKRTELGLIALLIVAGGILVWCYEPATDAAREMDASRLAAPASTSTDTRPSFAVLPFENRGRLEAPMFSLYRGDHEDFEQRARRAATIEPSRIRRLVVGDLRRGDYPAARARFVDGVPELFVIKSLKSLPVLRSGFPEGHGDRARLRGTAHRGRATRPGAPRSHRVHLKASSTIDVVAIHALRGETSMALAKLREGDAASIYTSELAWQYHRDFDPRLGSIRDEPEFRLSLRVSRPRWQPSAPASRRDRRMLRSSSSRWPV